MSRYLYFNPICVCEECDRHFNSAKLLSMHKRVVHKNNGGQKCGHCDMEFTDDRALKKHLHDAHHSWETTERVYYRP